MFNISYLAIAAFGFGLVVTLALAAWLTPARWWRQLNARALAIVGVGTWGIGAMVLALAQPPASLATFRVYEDLNLRAAKGTQSARIAVVPAGSVVTTTGVRDGDWWQVSAQVGGKEVRGWSSSLWLRRPDE